MRTPSQGVRDEDIRAERRSAPLVGAKTRSALCGERQRKRRPENSGGKPLRETGGAWPGEVGTGSPSGHATNEKKLGCLTIGSGRARSTDDNLSRHARA